MSHEPKLWHYYVPGVVGALFIGGYGYSHVPVLLYIGLVIGVGALAALFMLNIRAISEDVIKTVDAVGEDAHSRYNNSLRGLNDAQLILAYQHLTFTLGIAPDFLRKRPRMLIIGPTKPVYLWFAIKYLKEADDIAPPSIRNFPVRDREQEQARALTEYFESHGVVEYSGGSRGYRWAPGITRLDLAYGMGFTVDTLGIEQLGLEEEVAVYTTIQEEEEVEDGAI